MAPRMVKQHQREEPGHLAPPGHQIHEHPPQADRRRCAMVAVGTRKARAISSVVRPHSDRSVRLVQVLGLDQVIAAKLFTGFGERVVGRHQFDSGSEISSM
jgi:hypothetical protein